MLNMMSKRKKSIKHRLVIDFGAILVGICIVNYLSVLCIYTKMLDEKESDRTEIVTSAAVNQARLIIENAEYTLFNIKSMATMKNPDITLEEKVDVLKNYKTHFYDIVLVDLEGRVLSKNGIENYIDKEGKYINVLEGDFENLEILHYKDQTYIVFWRGIQNTIGELQNILMGVYRIEDLFNQVKEISEGELYFLANEEGQVIFNVVEDSELKEIELIEDDPYVKILFTPELQLKKTCMIEMENPFNNQLSNLTYGLINDKGWIVGVVSNQEQQITDVNRFKQEIILNMLVMIVISVVIVYFIATSIAKRMLNIAHYLEDSINSEFQEPVPDELLQDEDEIGIIAKELKQLEDQMLFMLDDVKESVNYLNDKVTLLSEMKLRKEDN